ncbi:hypothetical protein [Planomonospora venezuelensis]|uniref:DUF4267 domain-containing protein n=1 Tax=Planomonospora venezuelensis TaxID=1999 RepID=A0A841D614_PLAVE|nr:hypothetical protein [Planomonospora venezuelensis]MBB5963585.1 hypothetical protein [Planomonospora venezuelensis]GIN02104.1 hypothetical protein Pve01_37620 [Planomonospora venezuelensis]
MDHQTTADGARRALALVRIVMGTTALLAPGLIAGRLQDAPGRNPAAPYVLRLFGVRTVVMGLDLLAGDARALRSAPLVHASDALAALAAGRAGQVPWRGAAAAAGLSAVNTALALAALAAAGGSPPPAAAPDAVPDGGRRTAREAREAVPYRPDRRPAGSR